MRVFSRGCLQIIVYLKWADVLANTYRGHQRTLEVEPEVTVGILRNSLAPAALKDIGWHSNMMFSFNGKKLEDNKHSLNDLGIVSESVIDILW